VCVGCGYVFFCCSCGRCSFTDSHSLTHKQHNLQCQSVFATFILLHFTGLEMYLVAVAVSSELSQKCLGKVILAHNLHSAGFTLS
jgi:hypothetical protein